MNEQDKKDKQELEEIESKIKKLDKDLRSLRSKQFELKMKIDDSYSAIINRYKTRHVPTYDLDTSASRRWSACDSYAAKEQTIKELNKHNYPIPEWLNINPDEYLECLSG